MTKKRKGKSTRWPKPVPGTEWEIAIAPAGLVCKQCDTSIPARSQFYATRRRSDPRHFWCVFPYCEACERLPGIRRPLGAPLYRSGGRWLCIECKRQRAAVNLAAEARNLEAHGVGPKPSQVARVVRFTAQSGVEHVTRPRSAVPYQGR